VRGPAARISAGVRDTVIINGMVPTRIAVDVSDARGHPLRGTAAHFQRVSGAPIPVTDSGVVTCTARGDAVVRASAGAVAHDFTLFCRPVSHVYGFGMVKLVAGDPPRQLSFLAIGPDSQQVTLFGSRILVADTTIVIVEGTTIRGLRDGETSISLPMGERSADGWVHVYGPGTTPAGLPRGGHVALPVSLTSGEMRQWRLTASRENYLISMLPDPSADPMPRLAVLGANCAPGGDDHTLLCVSLHGGSVIAYDPPGAGGGRTVHGRVAVWRQRR
jgi:hypothetical protein